MSHVLEAYGYRIDLSELYERLWRLAEADAAGQRIYTSTGEHALKWVIADLTGTPVESGRSRTANAALRRQVQQTLVQRGWADRMSERRFRLVVDPTSDSDPAPAVSDADDSGEVVDAVPADAVVDDRDRLTLGGLDWSPWADLATAAQDSTTSPGVYVARCDRQLVYVGMAGERNGLGVRGRLRVYARGRGAVSGLGEAVLDRALADHQWVQDRLAELEAHGPRRTKDWAILAFERRPIEVAWAATDSAERAKDVEHGLLIELADAALWNRARPAR